MKIAIGSWSAISVNCKQTRMCIDAMFYIKSMYFFDGNAHVDDVKRLELIFV
jgi:hypothetical protein